MLAADSRYDSLFVYYGGTHNVDWLLLKATAWQESRFNPKAVSPAGAKGLMQFMPYTWKEWAPKGDPFNPEDSIEAAAKYHRWLARRPGLDTVQRRLAAYNAGPGRVKRLIEQHGSMWLSHAPAETVGYVNAILARLQHYEAQAQHNGQYGANLGGQDGGL